MKRVCAAATDCPYSFACRHICLTRMCRVCVCFIFIAVIRQRHVYWWPEISVHCACDSYRVGSASATWICDRQRAGTWDGDMPTLFFSSTKSLKRRWREKQPHTLCVLFRVSACLKTGLQAQKTTGLRWTNYICWAICLMIVSTEMSSMWLVAFLL